MDNLGSFLKSQREERGIALEEIASITKIHIKSLQMMEQGNWKALPAEPFIRGFLIAYSRYVGLEPNAVIEHYRQEMHPQPVPASQPLPVEDEVIVEEELPSSTSEFTATAVTETPLEPESEEQTLAYELPKKTTPPKVWIGTGFAVIALIAVPVVLKLRKDSQVQIKSPIAAESHESVKSLVEKAASPEQNTGALADAASVPAEATKEVVKEAVPVAVAPAIAKEVTTHTEQAHPENQVATVANPSEASNHVITVKVKNKSWSKVVIDSSSPVQKILEPGDYSFSANEKFKIVLGNSSGAEIVHNGEKSDGAKIDGTIRQFVFPNNARFPQDPLKRKVASPEKTESDAAKETPSQN